MRRFHRLGACAALILLFMFCAAAPAWSAVDPSCLRETPVDCGGDVPALKNARSPYAFGRAMQGPFVDKYDRVMYIAANQKGGKTSLYAMRWDEDPAKRVRLGWSGWHYGFLAHQENSLYRPDPRHRPLILAKGNQIVGYDAKTDTLKYDYSKTFDVNVIDWNYRSPATFRILRTLKLFDPMHFDQSKGYMRVCVSYDSKYLIGIAIDSATRDKIVRVWDMAKVMGSSKDDISASYESQFKSPFRKIDGQGIASDGRYVYYLSGMKDTRLAVSTLNGKPVLNIQEDYAPLIRDFRGVRYIGEPEGVFFAPYRGNTEMFLALSLMVYEHGDDKKYTRYNRFLSWSLAKRAGAMPHLPARRN